ncbi:hypothetical protein R1sor_007407 [Riccia sorocarpa]|uniref:Uncharacterized protein n=1 Tax=Riccia sorocarpa TaxID=122646 RepID=A0ABD3HSK3_9MARC
MSWSLGGWKRQADVFHLILGYGNEDSGGVDDLPLLLIGLQEMMKIKSPLSYSPSLSVAPTLPVAHDEVEVHLTQSSDTQEFGGTVVPESDSNPTEKIEPEIRVQLSIYKTREHLKLVALLRTVGSGPSMDSFGVLNRILTFAKFAAPSAPEEVSVLTERNRFLSVLNLSNCSLTGLPIELASVPSLQRLCLDNNKITVLPPELGQLTHLKVLRADNNLLTSVPGARLEKDNMRTFTLARD